MVVSSFYSKLGADLTNETNMTRMGWWWWNATRQTSVMLTFDLHWSELCVDVSLSHYDAYFSHSILTINNITV